MSVYTEPALLQATIGQLRQVEGETDDEKIAKFTSLLRSGEIDTLVPALPLLFNLKGKPYSLRDYGPMEELFRLTLPSSIVYCCSRQISKTSSLAAQSVLASVSIPNFTTLAIAPLFEQIRRVSTMFVEPFINQSPVKHLWCDSSTVDSVLHRSFKNQSKILFSFAFLNADRCRGISADRLLIDESVCGITTYVNTQRGRLHLKDVKSGDFVTSCSGGIATEPRLVLNRSYHGYRNCFELTFDNGSKLTCTPESYIATTKGYKRVSEIIKRAYSRQKGRTASIGNSLRRRRNKFLYKGGAIQKSARLVPARVQSCKAQRLIFVRSESSRKSEERWLRRMVKRISNAQYSRIFALTNSVLQDGAKPILCNRAAEAAQSCTFEMAQSNRASGFMGNDSLVGRRRRQPTGLRSDANHAVSHGGLQTPRSTASRSLAPKARHRLQGSGGSQQTAECRVLDHNLLGSGHPTADSKYSTIFAKSNALQDNILQAYISSMRLLPSGIYAPRQSNQRPEEATQKTVLRQARVPACLSSRSVPKEHSEAGQESSKECKAEGAVLCEPGNGSRAQQTKCGSLSRTSSGQSQSRKASIQCKKDSNVVSSRADMSKLSNQFQATAQQGSYPEILPNMQTEDCSGEQNSVCTTTKIVSIRFAGKRHVYDLEVDDTHNFCANGIVISNCQDLDTSLLPIIRECLSASTWDLKGYLGTPKTKDGLLETLWQSSSMAEWFVPCLHCTTNGAPTWNIPSMDHHVYDMIGPYHNDISEKHPATICYKCRKPISPRLGRWVHRHPERMYHCAGYHVPQIVMPMHYASPEKWATLVAKQEGKGNTSPAMFHNEVLGHSYDTSSKLVSLTELDAVSNLGPNNAEKVKAKLSGYQMRVLAVDWGGGGEKGISFTTAALLGLRNDGRIDVLWGKRLLTPHDHIREAKEIYRYWQMFKPTMLAHDYTGAGSLRETFLVQAGVPTRCIMPCQYVRSASQQPCFHVAPTPQHPRSHYRVDKSRTLLLTCAMIKCQKLRFFNKDYCSEEDTGLIRDFLALVEDKITTQAAGEIYRIGRQQNASDDFAQAVNFGCVALWYRSQNWPRLDGMSKYNITDEQLRATVPSSDADWDDEVIE